MATDLGLHPTFQFPCYHKAGSDPAIDPNEWFAFKFPVAAETYGAPFLTCKSEDHMGRIKTTPLFLNDDFFSAILGGDSSLGHRLIYQSPEETFYFYDYRVGAFCPTAPEKLKLLLSNYLLRCAQECCGRVDVTALVVNFRREDVLDRVIRKARTVLLADKSFFEGEDGQRRFVDGKYIEPTSEPSYEAFVKKTVVRKDDGKLTVGDAFSTYFKFCKGNQMQPLSRAEFKSLVAEVIREEFKIGLRHDVPDSRGKQSHGWMGLDCRLVEPAGFGNN